MRQGYINYQLVTPYIHRINAAYKSIATFKDHFISLLAGVHPDMLMNLWRILIPQIITTLNMMIQSKINPNFSAHTHLEGTHDFNKIPLAPAGTTVFIHKKSGKRLTWSPHGIDA